MLDLFRVYIRNLLGGSFYKLSQFICNADDLLAIQRTTTTKKKKMFGKD